MDITKTHVAHDLEHNSPLLSCRFDPSGRYIFAGAQDYSVWRFEIGSGKKTKYPTDSWVRGIAFLKDSQMCVTGGYDGRLVWWPTADEKPSPHIDIQAHKGWIRAVAVSPDQKTIATVGNDLVVRLWNSSDGTAIHEFQGHESHIYNVAFHPSGQHLATGDLMGNVIHWNPATGEQVRTWEAESLHKYDKTFVATIGGFRAMTFDSDGKYLACSGITNVSNAFAGVGNPSLVVFNWETGKQEIEHLSKGKIRGVAWGAALHPEGIRIAATGGNGGYLLFWKADSADEFHNMKLKDVARDMHLSPDGLHLATAHYNGHVYIHRMDAKAG